MLDPSTSSVQAVIYTVLTVYLLINGLLSNWPRSKLPNRLPERSGHAGRQWSNGGLTDSSITCENRVRGVDLAYFGQKPKFLL